MDNIPTNINDELQHVEAHDKSKVKKALKGTDDNMEQEQQLGHHADQLPKGWKDSRAYKGKNYSDAQRIEYIKEKKRKQSESDKALNEQDPHRNDPVEEVQVKKDHEHHQLSNNHSYSNQGHGVKH